MFLLTKPDDDTIRQFLKNAEAMAFSYDYVGHTRSSPPPGFDVDHNRILLGRGTEDYEKAKSAIKKWMMFDFSWVDMLWSDTPISTGRNVAMMAKHMGFYSLNASRIVYVFDDVSDDINRFGFAYGTLTDHNEMGEERFTVELNWKTNEVWYDLYAFSKPKHVLARLGYLYSRHLQREFVKASKAAMVRAVSDNPE